MPYTSEIGHFFRCLWVLVFSSVKEYTWDISWLSAKCICAASGVKLNWKKAALEEQVCTGDDILV